VPYRRDGQALLIVVSDPSDFQTIDEVGSPAQHADQGLRRHAVGHSEHPEEERELAAGARGSHRRLPDADPPRDEAGDENLTGRQADVRRQSRHPPGGLDGVHGAQRRASDIHIETQDDAVHVKYRIDGVLQKAMNPIDKRHHSTIISRIKVMAELDIAEKRVPQDGRFRLRLRGKTIDFRVSIMPSVHGEDAVIRILDKESMSEQFTDLRLDILGWPEIEMKRFRKFIREPYGMVLVTGPDRQRQDDHALCRAVGDQDD
jgi:type IV pilus assembly protein PilB